jgi:hypothetical protein
VTFWPAAATLDYGLGRSAELLYKLIAAAAVRNGKVKWRWHQRWRPRFSIACARQRFMGISHVLGMPPLRYPDSVHAPVVLSPPARPFSPDNAFFDSLDFDIFGPPAPATAATPGPLAGLPPPRPPRPVADAPPASTACAPSSLPPAISRPPIAASDPLVRYLDENFVRLPPAGPRASGAPAPTAAPLPPLTAVPSPPSEVPVVGDGEVVACTESDIASDSPVIPTEAVMDVASSAVLSNPLPQ